MGRDAPRTEAEIGLQAGLEDSPRATLQDATLQGEGTGTWSTEESTEHEQSGPQPSFSEPI